MPLPAFAASSSDRALAGVCGGIAQALGVDVTLVRLVFALLALAGGAGIVLYLALWLYAGGEHTWPGSTGMGAVTNLLGPVSDTIDATDLIWRFFASHRS